MNDGIFKEGGPYKVKRVGMDKYSMQMSIPADADGFIRLFGLQMKVAGMKKKG